MKSQTSLPDKQLIRPLRQEELPTVHEIECSCQSHPWTIAEFAAELDNPVASIDVFQWGNDIAGFLCSWLVAGELQIQNLATARNYRRKGIAGKLLKHVLERSRRAGLETAWLEVRIGNLAAIALYRGYGFREMSRRPHYYHDGEDALIMSLCGEGG
jgi:ribosomal-protein-alanine N-acetyltransferase